MKVNISLLNHDPQEVEFNELLKKNKKTIIYFYPKDDTPGCTIEAKDFSNEYGTFIKHGIGIYGVSKDTDGAHCNFISKHSLSIPLISDPELILHKKFGARGEKSNYGKLYE
jgi:peroxiredoxin Q/BCP